MNTDYNKYCRKNSFKNVIIPHISNVQDIINSYIKYIGFFINHFREQVIIINYNVITSVNFTFSSKTLRR